MAPKIDLESITRLAQDDARMWMQRPFVNVAAPGFAGSDAALDDVPSNDPKRDAAPAAATNASART